MKFETFIRRSSRDNGPADFSRPKQWSTWPVLCFARTVDDLRWPLPSCWLFCGLDNLLNKVLLNLTLHFYETHLMTYFSTMLRKNVADVQYFECFKSMLLHLINPVFLNQQNRHNFSLYTSPEIANSLFYKHSLHLCRFYR